MDKNLVIYLPIINSCINNNDTKSHNDLPNIIQLSNFNDFFLTTHTTFQHDTIDSIPEDVLRDCAQLVKANSIQGTHQ